MMTPRFIRLTVAGGNRPMVVNVYRIEAYGPYGATTFLQVSGESYDVSEAFEVVDALVHDALKLGGAQ